MENLFKMSKADNILYAKRCIVDSIYKQSRLEGIAVTFPETMEIYEGRSVVGLSVEDVIKVNNLKHAWQFIFDTVDYPMDLRYIRQINQEVGNGIVTDAGELRQAPVSIGGTSWKPGIPDYSKAEADVQAIMGTDASVTDKAITLMLYIMRSQLFYDGNKRTAQIAANQVMIQGGAGIMAIPIEKQPEFFALLVKYYETAIVTDIKNFLYQTSIDGFNKQHTEQPTLSKNMFLDMVEIINDKGVTEHVTRETLAMRILEGENIRIVGETEKSECRNAQMDEQDMDER